MHLILVPSDPDRLRRALAARRCRCHSIAAQTLRSFLASRFGGVAIKAHLAAALRDVSLNPARARLVERAQDWRWLSTSAHLRGRDDGLTARQQMRRKPYRSPLAFVPHVRAAFAEIGSSPSCEWSPSVGASRDQIPNRLFGNLSSSKWRFGNFVLNFAASHNDRIRIRNGLDQLRTCFELVTISTTYEAIEWSIDASQYLELES